MGIFRETKLVPNKFGDSDTVTKWKLVNIAIAVILAIALLSTTISTVVIVPEGHVSILKKFGKAIGQFDPGLHFKIPFITSVTEIEVRQRKNVEELAAATQNQLAITSQVSINWTVDKSSAMDLFIQYGGLDQFENRILDPKLRSSAKAALARFPADQLIRDRNAAVAAILEEMISSMEGFPVVVNSPQIENITFPQQYLDAVLEKERAREAAEREKHNLERQRLEAQQGVNTAEAKRDALKAEADGNAYKIKTEAEAEAEAIRIINEQLAQSDAYVQLVKARAWNGQLPQTLITSDDGDKSLLFQVK